MESLDYKVPFYPNTPDGTHCFQASIKSVLKFFWPEKDFSWEELEKITAKKEGLWTWLMAGLIWLQNQGFEVKNVEIFDYGKFIESPEEYLKEFWGEEIAKIQIEHCEINQEVEYAKKFLEEVFTEKRVPSVDDIKNLLKDGYLIICNVNSRTLNDKPGYAGHFVVVKGFNENNFIIHDPGLPPQENRVVPFEKFETAWAYPDEKSKNIIAFRHKNSE